MAVPTVVGANAIHVFADEKVGGGVGCAIIIAISLITNVAFSVVVHLGARHDLVVAAYRLSVSRYLFLFALVYCLVGSGLNRKVVLVCSLVSAAYIYITQYISADFEPFIFNSGNWRMYEFPSHMYSLLAFALLFGANKHTSKMLQDVISAIGVKSWGIFNLQMVYFATVFRFLDMNVYLQSIVALVACIAPVFITDKVMSVRQAR